VSVPCVPRSSFRVRGSSEARTQASLVTSKDSVAAPRVFKLHEAEAAGAARDSVDQHHGVSDGAEPLEMRLQLLCGRVTRKKGGVSLAVPEGMLVTDSKTEAARSQHGRGDSAAVQHTLFPASQRAACDVPQRACAPAVVLADRPPTNNFLARGAERSQRAQRCRLSQVHGKRVTHPWSPDTGVMPLAYMLGAKANPSSRAPRHHCSNRLASAAKPTATAVRGSAQRPLARTLATFSLPLLLSLSTLLLSHAERAAH
jgi:hypothetical protein